MSAEARIMCGSTGVRMGELEAVGDAVTGGVVGRAVEPKAGEAADGHTQETNCLNCGAPLLGEYCHVCGQHAHVHRTLSAFFHDLLHGVLHLDGKIWRTLPLLVWRPGELTRRYVDGERVKFVSPLVLFLFSVFVMFAVFSATGSSLIGADEEAMVAKSHRLDEAITRLERDRRSFEARGLPTAAMDDLLADARAEREVVRAISGGDERLIGGKIDTGWERFDKGLARANKNPQLLLYTLQTNAYKYSWAMIPLSMPFLWLLFLHRRRYRQQYRGYDHLVFITYSIAFMSLALVLFFLLASAGINHAILNIIFVAIPPLHVYSHLRGAYALSRWSAAWRTIALLISALFVITFFGLLLLALGVLG